MDKINIVQLNEMLLFVCDRIKAEKEYLTEIDSKIGDGDHGIGMSLGFEAASKVLAENEFNSVNEIFKAVGMSLIKTMGGASGVLFGTVFFSGPAGLENYTELNIETLYKFFKNSLDAVKKRGNAQMGDKTMVDALEPAVQALCESARMNESIDIGLKRAMLAAEKGVENTKKYVARFGKAKTLGERALGHPDAGAVSISLIFKAMSDWVGGQR